MNIEESMLLKGGKGLSDRILKFMDALVIKNNQEADLSETEESFKHYQKYKKCVRGISNFFDHDFSASTLPSELRHFGTSVDLLNKQLYNGNIAAVEFIQKLRNEFIDKYEDKNPYYARLVGIPPEPDQIIKIANRDDPDLKDIDVTEEVIDFDNYIGDDPVSLYDINRTDFPNFYTFVYGSLNERPNIGSIYPDFKTIPLHKVRYEKHPITYTLLYIEGYFKDLMNNPRTGYDYLKYLQYGLDIETVREADHFEILWFNNNILDDYTTDSFLKSYETIKDYVLKNKYMKNMEEMYEHYSNFQLMVILFGTFQKLCTSFVDRYSVRNYTDKEIYDILDSHNLSSLKPVDIKVLRRVVDKLDTLLAYRGTKEVLPKLMEVVSKDKILSIRKYDLIKKFKTNNLGAGRLTTDLGPYNKNTDLAFVDRTIMSNSRSIEGNESDKRVIDYDKFVLKDPTWAALGKYETEDRQLEAAGVVKNKLLSMEFNRLDTKYLGVVSVIDMHKNYNYSIHKLGLLVQFYGGFKPLNNVKYKFDGIYLTPLQLFTLTSSCDKRILSLDDSDIDSEIITPNCYFYNRVMKLNSIPVGDIIEVLLDMEFTPHYKDTDVELAYTKVKPIKVGQVLSASDIKDYIIYFDITDSSFEQVMSQYEENYNKFIKLIDKSLESDDYNTIMAWKTIREYFITDVNSSSDYNLPETFSNYFEEIGGDILTLYETNIKNSPPSALKMYAKQVVKAFKNSICDIIWEEKDTADPELDVKSSVDLSLLVEAFVSVYVELRDITLNFNMSDYPYNKLQFMDRSYMTYYSKFKHLYNFLYKYAIYEYENHTNNYTLKEYIVSEERFKTIHNYTFDEKVSLMQDVKYKSRFNMFEIFGLESEQNSSDSFTLRDKFKIEEIGIE